VHTRHHLFTAVRRPGACSHLQSVTAENGEALLALSVRTAHVEFEQIRHDHPQYRFGGIIVDGVTGVGRLSCVRARMMGSHRRGGAALVPAAPGLRLNLVALAVSASTHLLTRRLPIHTHKQHDSSVACLDANMFISGPLLLRLWFVVS
jgi:hypothetical protein